MYAYPLWAGVVGFCFALHWAGKVVYGYSPLGDLVSGLLPTGGEGVFWGTSRWGSWFNGYFPLGKLISGLLPAGGEGGLHDYSPLGERVGFWVTSRWGSWFNGYFPLGKLV